MSLSGAHWSVRLCSPASLDNTGVLLIRGHDEKCVGDTPAQKCDPVQHFRKISATLSHTLQANHGGLTRPTPRVPPLVRIKARNNDIAHVVGF